MENITPPTDNLYKFIAIGGLAAMLLCMFFLFREQAVFREKWIDAQVELASTGYQEGSGVPADPAARLAYFRREAAHGQGLELMKFLKSHVGHTTGISMLVSMFGFALWWRKVQGHDDAILRATAEIVQREARTSMTRVC